MAKFSKECLDAALEKLTNFTEDEVKAYMSEVFSRSREYSDLGSQASINKAIEEINNEKMEALLEEATITANNAKKFEKLSSMIKKDKANLEELSIKSRSDRNKDFNIESSQRSKYNEFHKIFHDELTPEEIKFVTNPENDLDIGRAIDGKQASKEAMKIAKLHYKLVDSTQGDLVTSNAMPIHALNKDRQINATHDRRKMMHPNKNPFKIISNRKKYSTQESKKLWMDEIKKRINIVKTYRKIGAVDKNGNVDMEAVNKSLSNTYDNIVNGYSEVFTRSGVKNDLEAIKKRQRMFFVWKDTESWLKYNEVYGTGNYYSALRSYIRSSANKVGAAQMFGDDASNMFMNLMDTQVKNNPKTAGWNKRTENHFKYITGIDHAAVNPTLAAFGSNLRALTGMARLGSIGILSIGDVVKGAAHVSKFGFGFWGPLLNNIANIFNNPAFASEERERIARMFKLNLDSHLGYLGKYVDATTIGNATSKFTNAFYKVTLMDALDKGNKISVMHMMAKGLADVSHKVFDSLGSDLKNQLSKYNISKEEWNLLRTKNQDGLFTTENVAALTDADLKKLQVGENKNVPLYEIKNDLMRKVYTLFDVANATAVGLPDVYIKSFLFGGTDAGTWGGEALRALAQFKAFPLQHIDRMYINNFKDADGVKAKSVYFMNMFIASFGLNILSNMLNYIGQGKSMPDINRMSQPEKIKFMMESFDSNIGLLYKGFSNSYPGKFKAMYLLSSPSTDFVGNVLDVMANAGMGLTGDQKSWKRAAKSAKAAAKGVLPTSTIPILTPYMNEVLGDKSYLQPGQQQLFGK